MIYFASQSSYCCLSFFGLFHSVIIRALCGLLATLATSLIFGSWFIERFRALCSSKTRDHVPERHREKGIVPTMGGIFIIAVVIMNMLFWCNLADSKVWSIMLCLLLFGTIGFLDDWYKIAQKKGISARAKFILQWGSAALVIGLLWQWRQLPSFLVLPCISQYVPDLGYFFIPWAMFVLVATSNAVNVTDGLDGLATTVLLPNIALFAVIGYLAGHVQIASYLAVPYAATGEITVIGSILIGALLGFLWFNSYPAAIFMGDVGSLALGAVLALMALMTKHEFLLVLSGGVLVIEIVSVILQVSFYKYSKKRLFLMAPIHHHFELRGLPESKITTRCGILSLILSLVALIMVTIC